VWTFYWSLADQSPGQMRQRAARQGLGPNWREAILNDLSRAHPDIRDCVSRIDVMRLGHAMGSPPFPGFLASEVRRRFRRFEGSGLLCQFRLERLLPFSKKPSIVASAAADRVLHDVGGGLEPAQGLSPCFRKASLKALALAESPPPRNNPLGYDELVPRRTTPK